MSQEPAATKPRSLKHRVGELGVFDPPLDAEVRERTLRAFLTLGTVAEFCGPAVDVAAYFTGSVSQPFFASSLWNAAFAALFVALLLAGKRLTLNTRVRVLVYAGVLLGVSSLHYLGGALSTAASFLAVPIALAAFFLRFGESAAVWALTLTGWWGLARFESAVSPVAPSYGFARLYASYAVAGLTVFWLVLAGLFAAHRRSDLLRREQSAQLTRQNAELTTALSARDAFLATVNHELRTPLTTIVGVSELLTRRLAAPDPAAVLVLHRAAVHLLAIVDNLLDLSRVRAGAVTVRRAPTDVATLLRDVVGMFRALLTPRPDVALECHVDADVPPLLDVDGEKVRRIITNLMANAVKATNTGSIRVLASYADGTLTVRVVDTGCGFETKGVLCATLPDEAHATAPRGLGEGMGIGLWIVRELLQRMDGTLALDSQAGVGTTATVRVPAAVAAPQTGVDARATAPAGPGHILIVDDHADIRSLFTVYCESLGWTAQAFATPEAAAAYVSSRPNEPIAAVLMDILMPGTDGIAGRALLTEALGTRNTPIVALTAHAAEDARTNLQGHGFDGILSKPIGLDQFEGALQQLLVRSPS